MSQNNEPTKEEMRRFNEGLALNHADFDGLIAGKRDPKEFREVVIINLEGKDALLYRGICLPVSEKDIPDFTKTVFLEGMLAALKAEKSIMEEIKEEHEG